MLIGTKANYPELDSTMAVTPPLPPIVNHLSNVDLGATQSSSAPFTNITIDNAASTDVFTVSVSTGTLSLNGVNEGTVYQDTVANIANLQALVYTQGTGSAQVTINVYAAPYVPGTSTYVAQGLESVSCFVAGTLIACPEGMRAVETLRAGDLVLVSGARAAAVRFVGRREIDLAGDTHHNPIRFKAGVLGGGLPGRDLLLSPDHAVLAEGVLIPARALVGPGVVREDWATVTYYHILLDRHDIVSAEGVPCETLLEADDFSPFDNEDEAVVPQERFAVFAPRVTQGDAVARVRAAIAARMAVPA